MIASEPTDPSPTCGTSIMDDIMLARGLTLSRILIDSANCGTQTRWYLFHMDSASNLFVDGVE